MSSSIITISLSLAERDRFWVGQVESIALGFAFRFRAFISVIGWSMVSFIRATNLLSFEACRAVLGVPCNSTTAVRKDGRSDLVVDRERLYKWLTDHTNLEGSKTRRLHSPFLWISYPTTVLECPACWRTTGMHSVTVTAPPNASCTVRMPP